MLIRDSLFIIMSSSYFWYSLFLAFHLCRSSLLEDLPITEDSCGSFCFPPRPQCTKTSSADLFTDTIFDSQIIARNSHGMSSSKYLKTHAFSPTVDWENKEVSSSRFVPFNLEQKDSPSLKVRYFICSLILVF